MIADARREQDMLIGADQIRELIPHSEKMCLLERVIDWNDQSIRCETSSHVDVNNPLRRHGHVSSICGIEYAAQAMALHAALCSDAKATARHGYLASARDTRCVTAYLDEHDSPLAVSAELEFADGPRVIYSFSIESNGATLVTGRAAVMMNQG
jgi:predicted hotdog family 3-hydroxylacyl-ACP dehydratase